MADWIKYNPVSKLYEISTDDGANFNPLDIDAAQITQGSFAAARIPNLDASKITSGTLGTARLGSGTADATTFLRGDQSWQVVDTVEEENGNWTPVLGGSTGTSGQTYDIQTGKYTKIGRLVRAYFKIQLSNKGTISGFAVISGLPYVTSNDIEQGISGIFGYYTNLNTSVYSISASYCPANSSYFFIGVHTGLQVTPTFITETTIANTTIVYGTIIYRSEI